MQSPRGTFAVSEAVELAVATRGDFIESRHAGTAIVLNAAGDTVLSLGNPSVTVLTRSALKPLQSMAMHEAGLRLADNEQLAMSLASHTGTAAHVRTVRDMLAAVSLTEDALLCPPALPLDKPSKHAAIKQDIAPAPVYMGCSGKHAAMLATCVTAGWSTADYTASEHPLQQHIQQTVQRLTADLAAPVTVDGCGAPVLGLTLTGLARGYRRLANADPHSPFPINRMMADLFIAGKKHPEMVEGPGEQDTIVMQKTSVFAKYGAEGISAMAAADGTVAVVKMLDGSPRASRAVALSLLTYVGAVSKKELAGALRALPLSVTGGNQKVGEIKVSIPSLL